MTRHCAHLRSCAPATPRIRRRTAFSMLETSIAVAILGVGLIMVAAIFPVALTQHQASAEQAGAIDLSFQADAILKARVNTNLLYVPPLPSGVDSPWYLLPSAGILSGANSWDAMLQGTAPNHNIYANLLNAFDSLTASPPATRIGNFPDYLPYLAEFPPERQPGVFGGDVMDHRAFPTSDAELQEEPNHLVWYGFYRRLATGTVRLAVAICKQRRGALYSEQDMSVVPAAVTNPTPWTAPIGFAPNRRLPVPWRVSVGYDGGNRLSNRVTPQMLAASGAGLGDLAPVGTKMMIQGASFSNGVPPLPIPAGRVLTVSNVVNVNTVDVLEDVSDLPVLNFGTGTGATFDVWLFPPGTEAGVAGRESPLLAWRTTL